ncbi:MAG: hypothetical protein F6K54_14460 [Okeania sp. SIO3B5]|uniref:hypothetical protein n=1 Tax=Okeania sp. SIO3B5 TaxID=2607811 RepID=UPI0013FF716E|nr:hypothetical protein [Okeania sp. SIO3B5]NEO54177.1 hypothetical protein [Okeania sp. SIO3B5]
MTMKITQITMIFLLACLTVVVGEIKQAIANPNLLVATETETEKVKPIPVSLPVIAVVKLSSPAAVAPVLRERDAHTMFSLALFSFLFFKGVLMIFPCYIPEYK